MSTFVRIPRVILPILMTICIGNIGAQNTPTRINLSSTGQEANSWSYYPKLSTDGRYVVYESSASNLVDFDYNGVTDIFVHDLQTGATERVSVSSTGQEADRDCYSPNISSDGRYVVFTSQATNLTWGDGNTTAVYIHDRDLDITESVYTPMSGEYTNNPSVSTDGRWISFSSMSSYVVGNDSNNAEDIFLIDRQTYNITCVSATPSGFTGNSGSYDAKITPDASYVLFGSGASDLIDNDYNNRNDLFLYTVATSSLERISISDDESEANDSTYYGAITADARYVAFSSNATNLTMGSDFNGYEDIFLRDRILGTTVRLSNGYDGSGANSYSSNPSITDDGQTVVFSSSANNLVATDTNTDADLFIVDVATGATEIITLGYDGSSANSYSYWGYISAAGTAVGIESSASNLVDNDFNGYSDIFVIELSDIGSLPATIVYVDPAAQGTGNDGTSWYDAYLNLQDALLSELQPNTEIWVAAGTYKASDTGDRQASFHLASRVSILGGFNGTEIEKDQRDPKLNPTILSGDLNSDDTPGFLNRSDNSYHVVYAANAYSSILDGLTITGGFANGASPDERGGGVFSMDSTLLIDQCSIKNNFAIQEGGALYLDRVATTITSTAFSGNRAVYGGAISFMDGPSTISLPTITSCTFTSNYSDYYGTVRCMYTSPTITNCLFTKNYCGYDTAVLASVGGGNNEIGYITNCTFTDNSSGSPSAETVLAGTSFVIKNSIFWNNTSTEVYIAASPFGTIVESSCLKDGLIGTGNIDAAPLFIDPATDDYRLNVSSPCVNTGLLETGIPTTDLNGAARDAFPDMGCYEYVNPTDLTIRVYASQDGNVKLGTNGIPSTYVSESVSTGGASSEFYAVPNSGYQFSQWSDGDTNNPRTFVSVSSDITVTAEFTVASTFQVTANAGENGSVKLTDTGATQPSVSDYVFGGDSSQEFFALANTGYLFSQWSDGNTDNPRIFTNVTADTMVVAEFINNTFDVTANAGPDGMVQLTTVGTPLHSVTDSVFGGSDSSEFFALANTGYLFSQWSDGNTDNPRIFTNVTADLMVVAEFINNTFDVIANAGPDGMVRLTTVGTPLPSVTDSVFGGSDSSEFFALANTGYLFSQWSDGNTENPRIFTNVTADLMVVAEFINNTFDVTANAGSDGMVQLTTVGAPLPTVTDSIIGGSDSSEFFALANTGYLFSQWSDGNTDNPRIFTNVTADLMIVAEFIKQNEPPIAVAENFDLSTIIGDTITLTGSNSHDPDTWPVVPITFSWNYVSGPEAMPGPVLTDNTGDLMEVTFVPTAVGSYVFELTVDDGADTHTTQIVINVVGIPEIDVTGDMDFGSIAGASGTAAKTYTISNPGTGALTLTGIPVIEITGDAAADFTVTAAPATSIAAGGQTTFEVTFDPSAVGVRSATISIANDDADENPYVIAVQGTGTNAAPLASATAPVSAVVGDTVNLSGSASSDADSWPSALTYSWGYVSGPDEPALTNGATAESSFVPTVHGTYTYELTVNDSAATATAQVMINVRAALPRLTTGVASVSSTAWYTVDLPYTYDSMVVVCTPVNDSNIGPLAVRVKGTTGSSFQIQLTHSSTDTTPQALMVHYMVIEEGNYTVAEHGIKMEAVKYSSSQFAGKGRWGTVDAQSYINSYSNPVVVGQVQTANDMRYQAFWARGASQSASPSATVLNVGRHIGEDLDKVRLDEEVGYVVFESGNAIANGISLVAGIGSDSIKGVDNGSYSYAISGLTSPDTAILAASGMDGGDGGFPILTGTTPVTASAIALTFEEDVLKDTERKHTAESVAYVVFDTP
ncbi:hypothetical protein BVY04_02760 [bacterium M21]|nr:hypothetical protein BVY04_02760 [bacterium M21]